MKKSLTIGACIVSLMAASSAYACYSVLYEKSDFASIKCPSGSKHTINFLSNGKFRVHGLGGGSDFRSFDKAAKWACSC